MRIYLIRHGQTEWNKVGRLQGNKDIPLDETGVMQALRVAEKMAGYGVRKIYTSPLLRAAATAEIVRQKSSAELVYNDSLKEIRLGEWEGLTTEEIADGHKELYKKWEDDPSAEIGYGVESMAALQDRAYSTLLSLCGKEDEDFIIISHGAWIRCAVCRILGIPLNERKLIEIDNTGINIVDYCKHTGAFKIITLNDVSH